MTGERFEFGTGLDQRGVVVVSGLSSDISLAAVTSEEFRETGDGVYGITSTAEGAERLANQLAEAGSSGVIFPYDLASNGVAKLIKTIQADYGSIERVLHGAGYDAYGSVIEELFDGDPTLAADVQTRIDEGNEDTVEKMAERAMNVKYYPYVQFARLKVPLLGLGTLGSTQLELDFQEYYGAANAAMDSFAIGVDATRQRALASGLSVPAHPFARVLRGGAIGREDGSDGGMFTRRAAPHVRELVIGTGTLIPPEELAIRAVVPMLYGRDPFRKDPIATYTGGLIEIFHDPAKYLPPHIAEQIKPVTIAAEPEIPRQRLQ